MLKQVLIIAFSVLICTASTAGQPDSILRDDVQEDFDYLSVKIDRDLPESLTEEQRFSLHQTVAMARFRQCKTTRCRHRMLQILLDAYPHLLESNQVPVAEHSPAEDFPEEQFPEHSEDLSTYTHDEL